MKTSIKSVIFSTLIMVMLLASFLAPGVAYAAPVLPSAFYGEVIVNEDPAPIGTVITGIIVDAAGSPGEGSIEVTEEGIYGVPPGVDGERLNIQTDSYSDVGKEIEFWVQLPGWAEPVKADQTSIYVGDVQELPLTVTLPQADLESLTEGLAADLVPGFEVGVYDYTLTASSEEDQVTLTATLEDATIKYSYGEVQDKEVASGVGEIVPLVVGENIITIDVEKDYHATTTYTITVTKAAPPVSAAIEPEAADYDLYAPGNVETTITWNDAAEVVSITHDEATLTIDTDYTLTDLNGTDTLAILQSYVEGIDPAAGAELVFTIGFDVGEDATFTVNVIWSGASATIEPEAADYDRYAPADVETTITWNDGVSVVSVVDDVGALATPGDYEVVGTTLTIKDAYLAAKLLVADDDIALTINFEVGDPATLTITAIDTTPVSATIEPVAADYDLYLPADVETTITWNDGVSVVSVVDDVGALATPGDYEVVGTTLTIKDAYLAAKLLVADDDIALTINFEVGDPATLTITAIDTTPVPVSATIEPVADYDLYAPGDVETTITWNDATSVVSVTHGEDELTVDTDYTVTDLNGTATLAILQSYIEGIDPAAGDELVFTIGFDVGGEATFTVNVIWSGASATIDPEAADYDLYLPADVETTITWGDATAITSINDGAADLVLDTDYALDVNTLTILDAYLAANLLAVDDSVALTITFDVGDPATFTVTAIDTTPVNAAINPEAAFYDLYAPGDIEIAITWNDATSVVSVTHGEATLTVDTDYTVTDLNGTATLAILQSYIGALDPAAGDELVFTIGFDVGEEATFTVNVIDTTVSFVFNAIDPQDTDVPFTITITAYDAEGNVATQYTGTATISDLTGTIGPGSTGAFVAGVWTGDVTITEARMANTITATDADITGTSASFNIYDVLLTLNDGWTLVSTDKWIDSDSSAWEGDAVLAYRYTSEGYLEATFADLKPVEALYVKMPGGGRAGLTYSDAVPGVSAKDLVSGWNLISSATTDNAAVVLSPLRYGQIGQQQGVGLTTLVSQGGYNLSGVSLYLATLTEGDWETLADTSLNPFDGYWVYMNIAKSFGVIPE